MGRRPVNPLTKDDLPSVGVSRLRALGVIRPDMATVAVKVGELERDVALQHIHFPNGGGWSFFVCPQCGQRRRTLRLTEDGRLVCRRCDGMVYRSKRNHQRNRRFVIERLTALLYGPPARLRPRSDLHINMDRRRRLEASLRKALIRERRERLERMKKARFIDDRP